MKPEIDAEFERLQLLLEFDDEIASSEEEILEIELTNENCSRLLQQVIVTAEIPEDEWNEIHPKMESQKIVVPRYLTSNEEREFHIEFSKLEYFYSFSRIKRKIFEDFKIPFPESLLEKLKPKSLKYIISFPMEISADLFELNEEKRTVFDFYHECGWLKEFCAENEILLPENFEENNKKCFQWKYFELKK